MKRQVVSGVLLLALSVAFFYGLLYVCRPAPDPVPLDGTYEVLAGKIDALTENSGQPFRARILATQRSGDMLYAVLVNELNHDRLCAAMFRADPEEGWAALYVGMSRGYEITHFVYTEDGVHHAVIAGSGSGGVFSLARWALWENVPGKEPACIAEGEINGAPFLCVVDTPNREYRKLCVYDETGRDCTDMIRGTNVEWGRGHLWL